MGDSLPAVQVGLRLAVPPAPVVFDMPAEDVEESTGRSPGLRTVSALEIGVALGWIGGASEGSGRTR